jgi:hypothetical protein
MTSRGPQTAESPSSENIPTCAECGQAMSGVIWLAHHGGPVCPQCASRHVARRWAEEGGPCDGECGRTVLDLRNRHTSVLACSTRCRRRVHNSRRGPLRPVRRCGWCWNPIGDLRRSDAIFCSTACRVASFRARRRYGPVVETLVKSRPGIADGEIADELISNRILIELMISPVRGWAIVSALERDGVVERRFDRVYPTAPR